MNPLGGPILEILFFPDWHDFLERVNQESSGFESLDPVRTTDGHGNTNVTQFEMSEPVDDSTSGDGPLGPSVLDKFLQFRRCHLGIGVVVECQRTSSIREFSNCAQKQHDGTGGVIADRFGQLVSVDRVVSELDHRARPWSGVESYVSHR